jgi:pyruvate/2-oxoglutarate/acetoin dehydrogenase E1 component
LPILFEHVLLYALSGKLAAVPKQISLTGAAVRREGKDITLITYGGSLPKTLAAADALGSEGISAEVIDLRCLRPLDTETIVRSVSRTRRAVVIDEGWRSGSFAAEIAARLMEEAFWELDAPVGRVCSAEVPIPYPRHLEEAALPQAAKIVSAARLALGR